MPKMADPARDIPRMSAVEYLQVDKQATCKHEFVQEYVLIHQERACVEIYRRRTDWRQEIFEPGTEISLESVGISVPVAAFYRRVRL